MSGSGSRRLPGMPWRGRALLLLLLAAVAFAVVHLSLDLSAFTSAAAFDEACTRLGRFVAGLAAPDLGSGMLARAARLTGDTLAMAVLGTALGLLAAVPLAIASSRAVVLDGLLPGPRRWIARLLVELCRLLLDVLRGVPDFVWAVLLANLLGVGPITGLLAIAVSVAGILGKVLGEQWDNLAPERLLALRTSGASRLMVFAYGIAPLGVRVTGSFMLMRFECAVRNASVIGVVGGGGLGVGLWDAYTDGDWRGVATMLLALLLLTAVVDLGTNLLRRRLRTDVNHPRLSRSVGRSAARRRRVQVALGLLGSGIAANWWLGEAWSRAWQELARIDWQFVQPYTLGMFTPSTDAVTWLAVARASLVPLAIGLVATVAGAALAMLLVPLASTSMQWESHRFTGERVSRHVAIGRAVLLVLARGAALLWRGVPEVAWLVVLATFFRNGVTPCVMAIALHSAGVLHRVFTDAIDDVPFGRLERIGGGRGAALVYGALPAVASQWRSYVFFQFEVNVRAGVALGLVGAGGLGQLFRHNLAFRQHADAAAFLWGMVLLTIVIDRTSRALQLRRWKC